MTPSNPRKAILLTLMVLLFASLACQTIINSGQPTSAPVKIQPTQAETFPTRPPPAEAAPTGSAPAATVETLAQITPSRDLDKLFAPFWEAWSLIHKNFVDQPVNDEQMLSGAIAGLQAVAKVGDTLVAPETALDFAAAAGTPRELRQLFVPFWAAWINADAPQDDSLMQAALSGMVDSLGDLHTSYMDPDQFTQANIPLDGEYEGIGAWVDPNGEFLTIVSPMPGSPAEAAGLQAGDEIIEIDGEDMAGIDGNLAIRRVLGPAGTQVTLTIRRKDTPEPLEFTITRAHITIPSVTTKMLDNQIGYVQLSTFGDNTTADLRKGLQELLAQHPVGLILDLRNNGGGYLRTAIEVASEFVGDGVIMYERYGDGSEDVYNALPGGLATQVPLVVVVNEGSASASEIVAGAIQDAGRGPLVGVTTFGKGSVQNWIPLSGNQGAMRITIARWYTRNNRQIHEAGLAPDYPVEVTEQDVADEKDPQLDKAIELLLAK